MKQMRIKSSKLAALVLLFALPLASISALADTTTSQSPQLSFVQGGTESTNATVITGRDIAIKEIVPDGFEAQKITVRKEDKTEVSEKAFTISASHDNISIDENFDPVNNNVSSDGSAQTKALSGQFVLQGSYYAILADGFVRESSSGKLHSVQTVKEGANAPVAITEYSSCTISYNAGNFTISDQEGVFEKFPTEKNTYVTLYESPGAPENQIQLYISNKNDYIILAFTPTNNPIQDGTEFKFEFLMPRSNELLLRVITPQFAIEEVENQIRQSNGESNTSYIVLEDGNSLDYITENFSLRTSTTQFGDAKFKIEWDWVPENPEDEEVLQLSGGNQDMQQVMIKPKEDDVKGVLRATVSYVKPNGDFQKTETITLPEKQIVIRGLGKPVHAIWDSYLSKYPDETFVPGAVVGDKEDGHSDTRVMDAYHGELDAYQIEPEGPYQYNLKLNMGAKNGAAQYATITATGDTDIISIQTQQGSEQAVDYKLGDQIQNKQFGVGDNTVPGMVDVYISAEKFKEEGDRPGPKSVTLTFSFFIPDRNGKPVEAISKRCEINLNVWDHTPSTDSTLKSLVIRDQDNKEIDFPFEPDRFSYVEPGGAIHLPYKTKSITLTPTLTNMWADEYRPIIITYPGQTVSGSDNELLSGESYTISNLEVGKPIKVTISTPSEHPNGEYRGTYTLDIVRDPASTDDTLKSLGLYYPEDTTLKNNLIQNFDPNVDKYYVEIPYSTQKLRVRAEKNDATADGPVFTPELKGANDNDPDKQWLDNLPELFTNKDYLDEDGWLMLELKLTSEASSEVGGGGTGGSRPYTVHLRRADPAHDATLKTMEVLDKEEQKLTYTPSFKPDTDTYTMEIPYATGQIKLKLTPTDTNVNNIKIYSMSPDSEDNLIYEMKKGEVKIGAATSPIDIKALNDPEIAKKGYHPIFIVVYAEDEETFQQYELRVTRAEPSTDALLKSLTVQDQNGSQLKMLAFHPDETSYSLTVPYETTGVSFTPTANYTGATIEIQEKSTLGGLAPSKVPSGNTSKVFQLDEAGKTRTFEITVTAEDGKTTKTYTLNFVREMPSSDARLKKLQVDNVDDFSPVFVSDKTRYEAIVSEGADGVIITPTANHPGATIRIILDAKEDNASNSMVVPSGQASDLIDIIKVEQEVQIEVTAQDGETKMVYTIHFTNENLIEKTSNADLRRLEINYGLMTPNFKPAITEYEVTVPEDTYSVDILPKADDPLAEVHVFAGTKEIGDYDGYYAEALEDGENPITIEVTSPDETVTKTYTVNVYRNEEDKLKNLTPLEAEDIDFENSGDVILVMIDEYPRVSSSVFEELKNYPEKTIIFQGNDYSLEFKASDLERVIPQREIYDFRMSFTSPDEDIIYDHIWDYSRNDDIDNRIVMLYFEQHTSLPGPATLHVSLGSRYDNDTLYWHYYNQERDRIDYYGSLQSNSKGNIAVRIDHFSTYLISPKHRIAGSADKEGVIDELGQTTNGGDSLDQSGSKPFPNTGAGEGA